MYIFRLQQLLSNGEEFNGGLHLLLVLLETSHKISETSNLLLRLTRHLALPSLTESQLCFDGGCLRLCLRHRAPPRFYVRSGWLPERGHIASWQRFVDFYVRGSRGLLHGFAVRAETLHPRFLLHGCLLPYKLVVRTQPGSDRREQLVGELVYDFHLLGFKPVARSSLHPVLSALQRRPHRIHILLTLPARFLLLLIHNNNNITQIDLLHFRSLHTVLLAVPNHQFKDQ
mmetsp:Transcript_13015/g.36927  ORF Transcript_13015/g.36927 Transcript_13015/m.36927 type:complete len:229 (+) Transcript_13015:331-1017(+)